MKGGTNHKMAENETTKPQEGSWNNMQTDVELKPKVEFELNKPVTVSFSSEFIEPKERPNKGGDGVFYIFDVLHEGQEKVIMTSAWSLLKGLKEILPLANKTVLITKTMKEGKQNYTVADVGTEVQKIPTQ